MSSCLEATRRLLKKERAILLKRISTMLSQDACLGVKTNSKRPGREPNHFMVSLETCAA